MFAGNARLVPFSGLADPNTGDEFDVEIAQESETEFRLSDSLENLCVEALSTPGDFKIRGIVRFVWSPLEPAGNRNTYVQVGDADFSLALQDVGILRPDAGTKAEFIVHDLSLWDETL